MTNTVIEKLISTEGDVVVAEFRRAVNPGWERLSDIVLSTIYRVGLLVQNVEDAGIDIPASELLMLLHNELSRRSEAYSEIDRQEIEIDRQEMQCQRRDIEVG